MSSTEYEDNIVEDLRIKFSKGQLFLLGLVVLVIAGLGYATTSSSSRAVSLAKITVQAESISASIIFTQREALVYSTKYAQWLGGSVSRRDVQIARALLAQRLSVVDVGGIAMGARATPQFTKALKESDALLATAPPGSLPIALRETFGNKAAPILNNIGNQSRKLVVPYQQVLDLQFRNIVRERAVSARLNLFLLSLLIFLIGIIGFWIAIDYRRKYQSTRKVIFKEQKTLMNARDELNEARSQLVVLKNLNTAKNEFISTINHELRTPLTSIIGYVDILRSVVKDQRERERGGGGKI